MGSERKLHPAAIAIYAVHALSNAALPVLVIVGLTLLGGSPDTSDLVRTAIYGAIGIAGSTIAGYVRWNTTVYWVSERAIHHRTGVVGVKETDVPLARVEALDVQQGPLQRLFGVQAVRVQTAGGGKGGEIELPALAAADVRALRERVGAARPEIVVAAAPAGPQRRLSMGGLLVAALTAGQLGIILPVLALAGQIAQQAFQGDRPRDAERLLPHTMAVWVETVAALLAAGWALSVLGAVVAFAGFTATRDGDRLRIRRGLVQRREATIPVARVRAVRVVEGIFRRPLGLAALHVEVSGYAKEASDARTLFPLLRRRDVRAVLAELLPELADDPGGLAPPPPRARRRYLLPPALAGAALGAAAWIAIPAAGPWSLLAALAGLGYGALRWRAAGWRLADGRLAVRSRRLARTTVLAPAANRESHSLAQNVLQRRAGLADLRVEFGKKTEARIRHLEAADARAAFAAVAGSRPGAT
jgi:putative membrane protein